MTANLCPLKRSMTMTSERRTLAAVQALLTNPDLTDPDSELIQEMFAMGGLAQEAAALLSQAAEETIGGIMANAMSHMTWLKSSGMRVMLGSSGVFDPEGIDAAKGLGGFLDRLPTGI